MRVTQQALLLTTTTNLIIFNHFLRNRCSLYDSYGRVPCEGRKGEQENGNGTVMQFEKWIISAKRRNAGCWLLVLAG